MFYYGDKCLNPTTELTNAELNDNNPFYMNHLLLKKNHYLRHNVLMNDGYKYFKY